MADISREQIVFELQAEVAAAQAKVERFAGAIERAKTSGSQVGQGMKNSLISAQKQLSATTTQLGRYQKASQKAAGSNRFLYQQVGYLVSDARYGLLGMANNLSIVAVGMQNMALEARKSGESLGKAFGRGLKANAWLLALQLFIAILPEIQKWLHKINGTTASWNTMVDSNVVKLNLLERRLKQTNITLKERNRLNKEAVKLGVVDGDFQAARESMQKRLRLVQIEQKLVGLYKEKYSGPGFWFKLWSHIRIGSTSWKSLFRMFNGLPPLPEDVSTEWARWEKDVNKRITKTTNEALKLFSAAEEKGPSSGLLNFMKSFTNENELFEKNPFESLAIQMNNAIDKAIELGADEGGPEVSLIEKIFNRRSQELLRKLGLEADSFQDGFNDDDPNAAIDKQEQESLDKLQSYYDLGLFSFEDFERRKTEIAKHYADERKSIDKAETDAKWGNAQRSLQIVSNALTQGARLSKKSKGLAKAAVITNAAAASIGIWRDYHGEKNTIPTPFNTIAAGVTQLGLIASTVSAINSINSSSVSGAGASSRPNFNIIGQNGNNALQATIEESTGVLQSGKNDQRVVLVTSDLEVKQNDQKVAVETATL